RIYVKPVLALMAKHPVHALAHITGGGIPGNLPRVLPRGCRARVHRGSWPMPPVFEWLRRIGPVDVEEMDRTFKQGIGMFLAVPSSAVDAILGFLRRRRLAAFVVGEVVRGAEGVEFYE